MFMDDDIGRLEGGEQGPPQKDAKSSQNVAFSRECTSRHDRRRAVLSDGVLARSSGADMACRSVVHSALHGAWATRSSPARRISRNWSGSRPRRSPVTFTGTSISAAGWSAPVMSGRHGLQSSRAISRVDGTSDIPDIRAAGATRQTACHFPTVINSLLMAT